MCLRVQGCALFTVVDSRDTEIRLLSVAGAMKVVSYVHTCVSLRLFNWALTAVMIEEERMRRRRWWCAGSCEGRNGGSCS
jgi:hypothetical protein